MDIISIFGLALGTGALLLGQWMEGGNMHSLVQGPAAIIVFGGTLGAVLLGTPYSLAIKGLTMTRWVLFPPRISQETLIEQVEQWSRVARKEGLLVLENQAQTLDDPFMAKGLQLLVDGAEPARLRDILETEVDTWEASMRQAGRVWETAGGYSPTIGILGAVMGLIHVMENLTDPTKLGAGIATAFVATIYGVGAANLIYIPIFKKIFATINRLVAIRRMFIDGVVGIANGENPRIIEGRLRGYQV